MQPINLQKRSSGNWELENLRDTLPVDCPIAFNHIVHRGGIVTQHLHDCLEIGYCRRGTGVFLTGQKMLRYQAGDVMVINEREAHGFYNPTDEGSEWNFLFLDPVRLLQGVAAEAEYLSTARFCGAAFRNCFDGETYPQIAGWVRGILAELQATPTGYQSAIRATVWRLLIELHRLSGGDMSDAPLASPEEIRRLQPALAYISLHLDEALPVAQLARMCCVSESTIRRLFGTAMGQSPQAYIARLRIQSAMALLQGTDLSILAISLRVGFPTLSSFYRQFQKQAKMTPHAWRKGRQCLRKNG